MYGKPMTKDRLIDLVSEQVFVHRGFGDLPRTHLEWDRSNADSQISIITDDVRLVLDLLENLGVVVDLQAIE